MQYRNFIKLLIPKFFIDFRRFSYDIHSLYKRTRPLAKRLCPICNYKGIFENFGKPPRLDARCTNCGSLERHRLFWLWFKDEDFKLSQPIIHFAPERVLEEKFRGLFLSYKTADLFSKADLCLNIEDIKIQSKTINTIICNHVLEHVDDNRALFEIFRVLSDDGVLICSVPIVEGWSRTYEKVSVETVFDRELHFGQNDHVRFYGRDFRDRLLRAGFKSIKEYTAEGEDVITHGLLRGEKIFICSKS